MEELEKKQNQTQKEEQEILQEKPKESLRRDILDIVKVLFISLAIVAPIRYFIVQPFIVRGMSMEPNFFDGEYLVVDEVSYYFREPRRGESIVFRYPYNPRQFFIKRIIGLPGETVKITEGRIKIINKQIPEGFWLDESSLGLEDRYTSPNIEITLGKDEYFVLGDNRDESSDSRVWGPLKKKFIVGRVFIRAWPISRLEIVSDPSL